MPLSTIPFDPSLVLGQVVPADKIKVLMSIADAQKTADADKDKLNQLIQLRTSLGLTLIELTQMGVSGKDLEELEKSIEKVGEDIVKAAGTWGKSATKSLEEVAKIKAESGQQQINQQVESPVDFAASRLEPFPISSDTMDMDVQFFRNERNENKSSDHASALATYVSSKLSSVFTGSQSREFGASVRKTVAETTDRHSIQGTLVIYAVCTHKQAELFAPLVLDVDNAIENWVAYTGSPWPIQDTDSMLQLAMAEVDSGAEGMPILSGVTYGSSFVGMVHLEQREDTTTRQQAMSVAASLRSKMNIEAAFANASGSYGIDGNYAQEARSLLSTSSLSSHCSLVTMGIIPTIKANSVWTAVKEMKNDPKENMAQLAAIQGASNTAVTSLASQAGDAKKQETLKGMDASYLEAVVSSVSKMDATENKVLDTNALMTAFDDYVAKAGQGESGVPINFYIKNVTQHTIAREFMNKYYPEMLLEQMDDTTEDSGDSDGSKSAASSSES